MNDYSMNHYCEHYSNEWLFNESILWALFKWMIIQWINIVSIIQMNDYSMNQYCEHYSNEWLFNESILWALFKWMIIQWINIVSIIQMNDYSMNQYCEHYSNEWLFNESILVSIIQINVSVLHKVQLKKNYLNILEGVVVTMYCPSRERSLRNWTYIRIHHHDHFEFFHSSSSPFEITTHSLIVQFINYQWLFLWKVLIKKIYFSLILFYLPLELYHTYIVEWMYIYILKISASVCQ